jgi:putative transposase
LSVLSVVPDSVIAMTRYRLLPTPDQEAGLVGHCAHARFGWNLACEQHAQWRPGRVSAPGYEGFRQVAVRPGHIQRLTHRIGRVRVPKVGWVRFRWSRPVPDGEPQSDTSVMA